MLLLSHAIFMYSLAGTCLLPHLLGGVAASTQDACAMIAQRFKNQVFSGATAEYANTAHSYYSAYEGDIVPCCVFRPTCANDVSKFIQMITSNASDTQIAIKGGGHSTVSGAANIQNGITVDLSNINGVKLDSPNGPVQIGSGEHWTNVYSKLAAEGLAVSGSRVSDVGVSGLILGGGISFFDYRGFVCASVINMEVVLASAEIVNANATSNDDLFATLKGGGNNFGVVTRFDMNVFPQDDFWGGAYAYAPNTIPQLLSTFSDYIERYKPQDRTHVFVAASFMNGSEIGAAHLFSTGGGVNFSSRVNSSALAPFTTIQPQYISTVRTDSMLSFAMEESGYGKNGSRTISSALSITPDLDLFNDLHKLFADAYEQVKQVAGIEWDLVFEFLPRTIIEATNIQGPNALGLQPFNGPFVLIELESSHTNPADDDGVNKARTDLFKDMKELVKQRNKDYGFLYLPYASQDQDVFDGYGPSSVVKLLRVSKEYDPEGFFQKNVPGGFKLPRPA